MNNIRRNLKSNPIIKFLSSIKIAVTCLTLLFILTFWGTVAQVDLGLYQAQAKFFHSWYFLALGFIPFPGGQLVLWVLFFNLLAVSITRFVYKWSHIGITLIHIGLLTYFVAAFVTFHVTQESNLTLMEGQGSNVSAAYHDWEIAVWKGDGSPREVVAWDSKNLKKGDQLSFNNFDLTLTVNDYYSNAKAYTSVVAPGGQWYINDSGITRLEQVTFNSEPEKNLAGGIFNVNDEEDKLLLYSGDPNTTQLRIDGQLINIELRRKRFELPVTIVLKDFQREMHPGTEMAKSFKSYVEVEHDGLKRDVLIYMNEPYRYKEYTFYQASYSIDNLGRELSTLAVVKNSGRLLPYFSALITFLGLAIHFLMMGFKPRKK